MARLAMLIGILVAAVLAPRVEAATTAVYGYWLSENSRAIIELAPCGPEVCGRMVWLSEPLDDAGLPKRDVTGAPLCGISLVGGFRHDGPDGLGAGNIYNPRDGKTYAAKMTLIDEDRLEVRGYVGVPLFGKSQVWTRASDNRGGC